MMQNQTETIAELLLAWFDQNARILPWREDASPYRVWISEIMLQQTRVEAVKPYFERFIRTFPTVRMLAEAEEEYLLKMWEGLGYYNRARNLQKSAQIIVRDHCEEIPSDQDTLLKLPGIGSYTAGAVASIAYQKPVPAVDGNVMRVITRILEEDGNILDKKIHRKIEVFVTKMMPHDRPRDFNQALMELGATVCVPNGAPKCERCPLQKLCRVCEHANWDIIPFKEKKKPRKIEKKTLLIIQNENGIVLRKRPDSGLLAGMYEFPMLEGPASEEDVLDFTRQIGFLPVQIRPLENSKHIFTHLEWQMEAYLVRIEDPAFSGEKERLGSYLLLEKNETERKYPIPSAFKAYTKYLKMKLGNELFPVPEQEKT
ncbi:MAG: A/G-specific adenine glycosylase [Lachnospiraceae bacterium]|nr:A/G-specific adenine glycosylase [Lachnospiraceae bacterium]